METYISKKETSVLKWDGRIETLNKIKEKICSLCEGLRAYTGYTTNGVLDKDILFINHKEGTGVGNSYNIGEYIVIDSVFIKNGIPKYTHPDYGYMGNPIKKYTENELNENFILNRPENKQ